MPEEMTNRERLLAIMAGRHPDRIPWIPRLAIWYQAQKRRGTLPARYAGWTLREIERDLGMGTPAREGRVLTTRLHDVEVVMEGNDADMVTRYLTPLGTVTTRHRSSQVLEQGGIVGARQVEHMLKGPADYPAVEYIVEHTEVVPTYEAYLAYEAEVGEDGVPLVSIGADPTYRFLQELAGYNRAFFHLHDYPELVAHLLGVLEDQAQEIQRVALDSPARLLLYGEHFDSQMTPPPFFERYMLPHFQGFARRVHERGKVLSCHADADASLLLDLILRAGYDMAECFVTAPMVPLTLERARAVLGTRVVVWGGVPSAILEDPVSDAEFEAYMRDLFRTVAPGDAFILGVADNVMAGAKLERIERVSEMVAAYGRYPVQAP